MYRMLYEASISNSKNVKSGSNSVKGESTNLENVKEEKLSDFLKNYLIEKTEKSKENAVWIPSKMDKKSISKSIDLKCEPNSVTKKSKKPKSKEWLKAYKSQCEEGKHLLRGNPLMISLQFFIF